MAAVKKLTPNARGARKKRAALAEDAVVITLEEALELTKGIEEGTVNPRRATLKIQDAFTKGADGAHVTPEGHGGDPNGEEGEEETNPGVRPVVRAVQIESPELITIEHGQPYGQLPIKGAYVRIRPSEKTTDDIINYVRSDLMSRGAKAVKVLPRPRAEVLLDVVPEKRARETLRAACIALVEAAASKDKEALSAEVEAVMARVSI